MRMPATGTFDRLVFLASAYAGIGTVPTVRTIHGSIRRRFLELLSAALAGFVFGRHRLSLDVVTFLRTLFPFIAYVIGRYVGAEHFAETLGTVEFLVR